MAKHFTSFQKGEDPSEHGQLFHGATLWEGNLAEVNFEIRGEPGREARSGPPLPSVLKAIGAATRGSGRYGCYRTDT